MLSCGTFSPCNSVPLCLKTSFTLSCFTVCCQATYCPFALTYCRSGLCDLDAPLNQIQRITVLKPCVQQKQFISTCTSFMWRAIYKGKLVFMTHLCHLQGEFGDDGTEIHFVIDGNLSAMIKTVSSGKRRTGLIQQLFVNDTEIPEVHEWWYEIWLRLNCIILCAIEGPFWGIGK